MGWVRVDDAFYDHGRFARAGLADIGLWLMLLAWSNRNLTDGFIPHRVVAGFIAGCNAVTNSGETPDVPPSDDVSHLTDTLTDLGILEPVDGGYVIHDYLQYQPSAEKVRATRNNTAERVRRHRANRNGERNGVTNGGVTGAPNPNPKKEKDSVTASGNGTCNGVTPGSDDDPAFGAFWAAYPKKVGKGQARTAWRKAIKNADPTLIVAAAEKYRDDPARKPDYTAHPSTWLNGERWLDQPTTPTEERPAWWPSGWGAL